MRIYLAGPINGCTDDEAMGWREWFKFRLKHTAEIVDPMARDYRGTEARHYREIVEQDKADILGCDVVIVMYVKPSVGTAMETHFAWAHGIPVVVVDESDGPLSPWLTYHTGDVVKTKEEAALWARRRCGL